VVLLSRGRKKSTGYTSDFKCKYICSKCKKIEYRSIGQWKIECSACGSGSLQCPKEPWQKEKQKDTEFLKQYRKDKKWSQKLMAAELGLEQGTLSKIERGILEVPPEVKQWIEKVSK
jgi:DNA-binding XRE family transcriptional regulator